MLPGNLPVEVHRAVVHTVVNISELRSTETLSSFDFYSPRGCMFTTTSRRRVRSCPLLCFAHGRCT